MRKKIIQLLVLCCFVCGCLTVSACAGKTESVEDFVNGMGNTVCVKIDYCGGIADENTFALYYVKPGGVIPEPGFVKDVLLPERKGYILKGFYLGTKDGETVSYESIWNFSSKVNEALTLYCKWDVQYRLDVKFVVDGKLAADKPAESYPVANNEEVIQKEIISPTWKDHTFNSYFLDEACTKPVSFPFAHGCTQEDTVRNIYASFIEGEWTIVREAKDMRTINTGSKYYLLADIDYAALNDADTGLSKVNFPSVFKGKIEGNGHTIRNLHYRDESSGKNFGLFGSIEGGNISNLVFEDCSLIAAPTRKQDEYLVGFIAGAANGESNLSGIILKNCSVSVDIAIYGMTEEEKLAELEKADVDPYIAEDNSASSSAIN